MEKKIIIINNSGRDYSEKLLPDLFSPLIPFITKRVGNYIEIDITDIKIDYDFDLIKQFFENDFAVNYNREFRLKWISGTLINNN